MSISARSCLWFDLFLFRKWIQSRVGARPDAARSSIQVARNGSRTAMCIDSRRLVWKELCRIDHFSFQTDFFTYMVTITDFYNLPGFDCQLTPPKQALGIVHHFIHYTVWFWLYTNKWAGKVSGVIYITGQITSFIGDMVARSTEFVNSASAATKTIHNFVRDINLRDKTK